MNTAAPATDVPAAAVDGGTAPAAAGAASPWNLAAEDLRTLAWLHGQEHPSDAWRALARAGFPDGLVLVEPDTPSAAALRRALQALHDAAALPQPDVAAAAPGDAPCRTLDDELAADYAGIYLTHAARAAPYESVWLDEDQLMMQAPTFAVRASYARHGLTVPDWRLRPDDHLSHELAFVAARLDADDPAAALAFLDDHLMRWLPAFAARVAERAGTALYAALAPLTLAACRTLHAALAQRLDADDVGRTALAAAREASARDAALALQPPDTRDRGCG